ncbi:hypothetical protein HHI36_006640 [Cryptolaemus montrouzieri]|uniref:Uncharacterized protein n=1 Tax=Cryptolaemus montrouzieri TaxID=559131 RepID=A0ABD2NXQ2_9CUCU
MRGMGLKQLVKDFTRITDRSNTTVDLVFSNILELKVAVLKEPEIADSSRVSVKLSSKYEQKIDEKKYWSRDLKKLKTANIEGRFKRRNWVFGCGTEVYTEIMDDMVDEFYMNVESVIDEVAPLELRKMKNKRNWFDNELKKAMKLSILNSEVKKRNFVTNLIEKKNYYERMIDNSKNDGKQCGRESKK